MFRIVKFLKNIFFIVPITLIFYPFSRIFPFLYYFNKMLLWIYGNRKGLLYCDFFSWRRDYQKRYRLYEVVSGHFRLTEEPVTYLEFGVASGASFRWWLENNSRDSSRFYGFDTFTGLPEDWGGLYAKGAMSHAMPELADQRARFVKGLFQDTLNRFIRENEELLAGTNRKIIHLDADLYSATIFTLSQLYPWLRKGDILLFDEFNVPLHEFKAYLEFTRAFYIRLKPVAAVNNFYQTAFIVA